jgi:hypothetical protein
MFKTRKVIAEIFSIAGAIRLQCTLNLQFEAGGGLWYTSLPNFNPGNKDTTRANRDRSC